MTLTLACSKGKNLIHGSPIEKGDRIIEEYHDVISQDRNWWAKLSEEQQELVSKSTECHKNLKELKVSRGSRYADCSLANYQVSCEEQKKLISELQAYIQNVEDHVNNGQGLLLFGPKGAGKDHCLMGVSKFVIAWGFKVHWQNGLDLWSRFRSTMRRDARETETEILQELSKVDVLWISDPLPPSGNLSEYEQQRLFQLIDRRYNEKRPTFVSMNVASGVEAEERLGAASVDRLRDGAITFFCNWASHRQSK